MATEAAAGEAREKPAESIGLDVPILRFQKIAEDEAELARWIAIAESKAAAGVCELCKWMVKKERWGDFGKAARQVHLVLCCDPDAESNQKYRRAP